MEIRKKVEEFNLLDDFKEGFDFHGVDKNGTFETLKKFHYFSNGKSLCGKYTQAPNTSLIPGGLHKDEVCKECLRILEEKKNKIPMR